MSNVKPAPSSTIPKALKPDTGISLGLGLTNECNLKCAFCYRDPARADRLSFEQVKSVIECLPVRSVNLGTGENGMHPDYKTILGYLRTRPVKLTITSNGHSVAVLEDHDLRAFHDIEFSLDFPTQAEQDAQRGLGNWELIHQQAERCVRLGVPVTIIAVMMKSNYSRLADVARVAKLFGAPLRVNVYQAVRSDLYALTYEEYWQGFLKLFESTDVIAIGEPLVRAMAGLPPLEGGCGVIRVRDSELCAFRAGSYTSRSVPVLRVSRLVSWRVCWTTAPARGATAAGFLLSDHSGRAPAARHPHGRKS